MESTVRSNGAGGDLLPRPGDVICGKYRIENVIGTGGMGVVLGAVDTTLGRSVAIKLLSPQKATREGAVARFIREARAAAAIQSEHVVRVFEVSTLPNGAPFIVMEHLRGADLSQVLRQRGPLPFHEACDLVLQACEALGEAHARGIVHRDLKPQNLYLTQQADGSPCVKVLDFGISKAAVDEGAPNLTSTDMVMGTPLYMSPEQVRSLKNVDARADIWALGSILFELLTTAPIFQAPSASALCAMIAMDPPTPLRARRPEAPPALEAVILRCLHKDPAGRFQDVAALADALAPFASERGRQSAGRVAHVVRATTGQGMSGGTSQPPFGIAGPSGSSYPIAAHAASPMGGLQLASTMGPTASVERSRGSLPGGPGLLPTVGPGASHPPFHGQQGFPTTQSTWQQTSTGAAPPQPRGSNSVVVALLGVLTGLALLAVVGGGAWWFVIRKDAAAEAMPAATADASTVGATSVAATTTATASTPSTPSSTATATATATATSPSPKPGPAPTANKDGGAPSPAKDAGAPTPPAPGPNKKEEEERLATLGRAAEQQCANHRQNMTTFARDEASRKRAATQAKTFMCRGMVSSRCERQVCLEACLVLDDKPCIQQIKYVIDHGPAPKY